MIDDESKLSIWRSSKGILEHLEIRLISRKEVRKMQEKSKQIVERIGYKHIFFKKKLSALNHPNQAKEKNHINHSQSKCQINSEIFAKVYFYLVKVYVLILNRPYCSFKWPYSLLFTVLRFGEHCIQTSLNDSNPLVTGVMPERSGRASGTAERQLVEKHWCWSLAAGVSI